MKELPNITCFHEACAAIFADLYSKFPARITIDEPPYQQKLVHAGALSLECAQLMSKDNLIDCSLQFLFEEGLITYSERVHSSNGSISFERVCLTSKGFSTLDRVEDLTHARPGVKPETIGSKLVSLMGRGIGTATETAIREAVKTILSY